MLSPTCQAAVTAKEKRTPLNTKKFKDGKGDGLWLEALDKLHKACKGVRTNALGQFICDCDCHKRTDR